MRSGKVYSSRHADKQTVPGMVRNSEGRRRGRHHVSVGKGGESRSPGQPESEGEGGAAGLYQGEVIDFRRHARARLCGPKDTVARGVEGNEARTEWTETQGRWEPGR